MGPGKWDVGQGAGRLGVESRWVDLQSGNRICRVAKTVQTHEQSRFQSGVRARKDMRQQDDSPEGHVHWRPAAEPIRILDQRETGKCRPEEPRQEASQRVGETARGAPQGVWV